VTSGARELDQRLDGRTHRDRLRLRRPAAAHRDDDDVPVASEEAGEVTGDGRLAHALSRADHRDRRQLERRALGRIEAEVRSHIGDAERKAVGVPPLAEIYAIEKRLNAKKVKPVPFSGQ
jgi:hypothetical protein